MQLARGVGMSRRILMKSRFMLLFIAGCSSAAPAGLLGPHGAHTASYLDSAANVDEFAKLTLDDKGAYVAQVVAACSGGTACAPKALQGSYTSDSHHVHFADAAGTSVSDFTYQVSDTGLELTNVANGDRFVMVAQALSPTGKPDGECQYPVTCGDGTTGCADMSDPCYGHGGDCSPPDSACVTDYDCCPGLSCDNASESPTYNCAPSGCHFPVTCRDGTTGCADTSDPCTAHGGDCSASGDACATDYDCCPNLRCDNTSATPTYQCIAG
jgi:hypothetical protein